MNTSSCLPSGPIKGINLHWYYMPPRGRQFWVAGMAQRTSFETSDKSETEAINADGTSRQCFAFVLVALVVIIFFFRRWRYRGCVYGRDQ